jgi:hypothetical protein
VARSAERIQGAMISQIICNTWRVAAKPLDRSRIESQKATRDISIEREVWLARALFVFVAMQFVLVPELPNLNDANTHLIRWLSELRNSVDITRDLKKAGVNGRGAA